MRQAYDYWQDQPDSFRTSVHQSDRQTNKARSATRLAVIRSFNRSHTRRNLVRRNLPHAVPTPPCAAGPGIARFRNIAIRDQPFPPGIEYRPAARPLEVPAKTPLSQATLKSSEMKIAQHSSSNHHCPKALPRNQTAWQRQQQPPLPHSLATCWISNQPCHPLNPTLTSLHMYRICKGIKITLTIL